MSWKVEGKTEGGSGGKRGHSNQCHWNETEIIKEEACVCRRILDKEICRKELNEIDDSDYHNE